MPIPVIDLFAGPGGLGEGFSSLVDGKGKPVFKIKLSIEKDEYAHHTLELRAFFRQFPRNEIPSAFYDYLAGLITRVQLFEGYPKQASCAAEEAWLAELGASTAPNNLVNERIIKSLNGESHWVLIGGPPCQAYSLVGRSRIRGESEEKYQDDHRHFLYREYLRILAVHQPPIFIMENVKGLLSAEVKHQRIFPRILSDLINPRTAIKGMEPVRGTKAFSYRLISLVKTQTNLFGDFEPEDFIVRAEKYGIPQARHRVIILGVRADVSIDPHLLSDVPPVSIEDVIGDLPRLRSGLSKEQDSAKAWQDAVQQIAKAEWLRNGEISKDVCDAIKHTIERVSSRLKRGDEFLSLVVTPKVYSDWFIDPKLGGICNHTTRGHIRADLHRYFFATLFARIKGHSPQLEDFPKSLLPKHENVKEALKGSKFNDRFRVQVRGRPSTTVVSHISKDGHYFIHYDPTQCRSLTVREAARLQTFPDNYFFEGPRTEQYRQVGNAVPPLLAQQIAKIVAAIVP
jgi:DNA (cytosine-5)-methyltransferase 1